MFFAADTGTAQALQTLGLPGLVAIVIILAGVVVYLYKDGQKQRDLRIQDLKDYSNKTQLMLESIQALSQRQSETGEKIYGLLVDGKRR